MKPKNKTLIYTTFNISQMQTQLLVIDSVVEDMAQYPLYFFVSFVANTRDYLKPSSARICSDFANRSVEK